MGLEAIALVGRQNELLHFSDFSKEGNVSESQGLVFMSLDFLIDKLASNRISDPFIGLYYFLDRVNFYAYCSATMVKVILVYQWDVAPPKDQLIKQSLQRLFERYIELASNPFHSNGSGLNEHETKAFREEILRTPLQIQEAK